MLPCKDLTRAAELLLNSSHSAEEGYQMSDPGGDLPTEIVVTPPEKANTAPTDKDSPFNRAACTASPTAKWKSIRKMKIHVTAACFRNLSFFRPIVTQGMAA